MNLVMDLHCHTIASGHAYSTIAEMASEAARKGLALMAMTDHGPTMPGGPDLYHFGNLIALPREICGVKILRGVEANIINAEGELDIPERYLKKLDIVLAGLHDICYQGEGIEENTMAVINAMKNPFVDIIVHPGNPRFPLDRDKITEAAIETGTLLEINNSSFLTSRKGSYDNCLDIAMKARKKGLMVCFGSDAHFSAAVGEFGKVMELVDKAGIGEEQIVNTSLDKLRRFMNNKGKRVEF